MGFGKDFLRNIAATLNPQAAAMQERALERRNEKARQKGLLDREDAFRKLQFERQDQASAAASQAAKRKELIGLRTAGQITDEQFVGIANQIGATDLLQSQTTPEQTQQFQAETFPGEAQPQGLETITAPEQTVQSPIFGAKPDKGKNTQFINLLENSTGKVTGAIGTDQDTINKIRSGKFRVTSNAISGAPKDFNSKNISKLKAEAKEASIEAEKDVRNSANRINDVLTMVESDDFVGGAVGTGISLLGSFNSQISNAFGGGSVLNEDGSVNSDLLDINSKNRSFVQKASHNRNSMEAAIVELAYSSAKINDPGGRVTDKDFDFARQMVAAGADKASLSDMLKGFRKRKVRQYNVNTRVSNRRLETKFPFLDPKEFTRSGAGRKVNKPASIGGFTIERVE